MVNVFKIEIKVLIDDEDIDDLMSDTLDNISYWCNRVEVVGDYLGEYASEQISRGGILRFYLDEAIREDEPEYYELDRKKLVRAIEAFMCNMDDCSRLETDVEGNARLNLDQIDGNDCNAIVQSALFGEVVFG